MKRRQFLRGLGAITAGAAVGLRASRAGAESAYVSAFRAARAAAKPMIVATLALAEDFEGLERAQHAIETSADLELAVRLMLVVLLPTGDAECVTRLTNDRSKFEPPSLALIDGATPRLIKETKLDGAQIQAGLERFLRAAAPLTPAWLEARVALLQPSNREVIREVRRRIAAGHSTVGYAHVVPAVVVLEAIRRKGAARNRLLADLLLPLPPLKEAPDSVIDCGLGAQLINPIGRRFASAFTGAPPGDLELRRKG